MTEREEELLDELVRLVALSLRRGMDNQNEAILAFLSAGFAAPRVAELVGTTPATVRAAKQAAKLKAAKKGSGGAR